MFNKIDINSIQVRKFNLDGCEDHPGEVFEKHTPTPMLRVCLPIFTQDILDSLNCLDLNSSNSKSHLSLSHHEHPEPCTTFESGQKSRLKEHEQCLENSITKMSCVSNSSHADMLIQNLLQMPTH